MSCTGRGVDLEGSVGGCPYVSAQVEGQTVHYCVSLHSTASTEMLYSCHTHDKTDQLPNHQSTRNLLSNGLNNRLNEKLSNQQTTLLNLTNYTNYLTNQSFCAASISNIQLSDQLSSQLTTSLKFVSVELINQISS
jgi:hypothetical protein